jgi:hypothetical protein
MLLFCHRPLFAFRANDLFCQLPFHFHPCRAGLVDGLVDGACADVTVARENLSEQELSGADLSSEDIMISQSTVLRPLLGGNRKCRSRKVEKA